MKKLLTYVLENLCDEKHQKIFFQALLICFVGISFYSAICSTGCLIDTVEHIHASYLVSLGKIPYKDFFEHHNPLLWYVFASVTKIFYRSPYILPVAQCVGVCGYLVIVWLVYKINERFVYGAKAARLSLIILITVPYLWKNIATLRPDIFMMLCFLGAIYYFLDYLEEKSRTKLVVSYFLTGLSFLFLQKIAILGLGFLGINLYYLHLKKIRLSDFLIAGGCAVVPFVLFFSYFFYNEALGDWFYYNFTFNMFVKKYYDGYTAGLGLLLPLWAIGSFFIILRYYKWEKRLIWLISFYFLSTLMTVLFAPFLHYFVFYFIFASVLLGKILLSTKYFRFIYSSLVFFSFVALVIMCPSLAQKNGYQNYFRDTSILSEYTTENEPVFSLQKVSCNLFNPSPSYYWFGLHVAVIIDLIHNPQRKFDLMSELKSKPTNFICYGNSTMLPTLNDMLVFAKSKYFIRRNSAIIRSAVKNPDLLKKMITVDSDFWQIDEKWIEENYTQIGKTNVWKKK